MKENEENGHDDHDGEVSKSEVDTTSSVSSSVASGPFKPLFQVKVQDAVKNGETLQFNIKVYKSESGEEMSSITRIYDDLEWLQHCLMTQNDRDGIIVPPLPNRPETDAKAAESKSKKQLGSSTKVIVADEFTKDCRSVEKYLKLIINHDLFGRDEQLKKFLLEKEAPVRAKVKRGILSRMSSMVDEARKGQHKDIDEFFQRQREWASTYGRHMKDASNNFNRMVYAQLRLASCYGDFASCVPTGADEDRDQATIKANKYLKKLGGGLESAKHGLEVLSANDEKTVAFQLDLFARYMESVKEMLFKRTCLMVDYEDSLKALEKAKPNKKATAEETKNAAEKAYETCTDNARKELKSFLHYRLISFEDCLSNFAESQIKTARDTYTLLVRTLNEVKQMD